MSIFIRENISEVLGFVNPVIDSADEDVYIFNPERRFSDAF